MDVLADRLERARARGAVFALTTVPPPWGVSIVDAGPLSLHTVLVGDAWLSGPALLDRPPIRLLQGDVALVHSKQEYRLADDPQTPCIPVGDLDRASVSTFVDERDGPASSILCGEYVFEGSVCDSLLETLPPVLCVRAGEGPGARSLRGVLAILADEVANPAPGQRAVLDRLLDLALVFTMRSWFARPGVTRPLWYAALDDPLMGRALRLIHEDVSHRWTVDQLASAVGMSRAAFARRFTARVGQPPLAYLTDWRMTLASETLRTSDDTIGVVARSVGYDNEFAFSTAYRRHHGTSPGRHRRAAGQSIR